MRRIASIKAIKSVNFTVGFALLAMLAPVHGHFNVKPAGVRTAIQAAGKKISLGTAPVWLIAH